MIKNLAALTFFTFCLTCCNKSRERTSIDRSSDPQVQVKELTEDMLSVSRDSSTDISTELMNDFFGRFFGDRAEFFVVRNPDYKVYDKKVNTIVLFYLDGQLCQTKYYVAEDISENLLRLYGKCVAVGFDHFNRELLEKEGLISGENNRWKVNDKLTNYELTWQANSKDIKLRVNKDDHKMPYQYSERLMNYDNLFKKIELSEN